MNVMKQLLCVILVMLHVNMFSCLNAEGFDIFGKKTFYDIPIYFIKKINIAEYKEQCLERERELKADYKDKVFDSHYYTEMAFVRIFQNNLADAKLLCLQGLKSDSSDYSLNSNLTVIYELQGNIDSALYLMKKAIKINPGSHFGSEWIHLKILEATQQIKKNKNWIYTHNVLNIKISKDSLPYKHIYPDSLDWLPQFVAELEYQLGERMVFVKPLNPVVGNLLLSLGDLYITEIDYRYANEAYLLAKEYDPNLSDICNKRLAYISARMPGLDSLIIQDSLKAEKIIADQKKLDNQVFNLKMINYKIEAIKEQQTKAMIIRYSIAGFVGLAGINGLIIYRRRKKKHSA